jgi:hypothetical protein
MAWTPNVKEEGILQAARIIRDKMTGISDQQTALD